LRVRPGRQQDVRHTGRRAAGKGRPIFIEGRLKFDSWESAEGRRSKLAVVAEDFQFIGGRGGSASEGQGGQGRRRAQGGPQRQEPEPKDQPDEGMDVADDEIPF
jgi:single-strand DNA-binding protein